MTDVIKRAEGEVDVRSFPTIVGAFRRGMFVIAPAQPPAPRQAALRVTTGKSISVWATSLM
ncbi:MAG: hypothetical protein ABJC89_23105 [Acidobacteriota bacterium]